MEKIKLQKVFAHFCHCYCYCLLPTFKMSTFSNFQRKVSLIWTKIIARNYLETKRWEWKNFCKLEPRQSSSWQALPMDGGEFFFSLQLFDQAQLELHERKSTVGADIKCGIWCGNVSSLLSCLIHQRMLSSFFPKMSSVFRLRDIFGAMFLIL